MSSQQAALQRALAIQLSLQISISAIPIIEEWMDIPFTRWLESVPSPPEMPSGHDAHFGVVIGSDLSRLTWSAYGNPAGFIPKMARYLEQCRIGPEDIALIDALGNGLEPTLVGSWVHAEVGKIRTGWQFCDAHRFDSVVDQFGDHQAKAALLAWLSAVDIEQFRRFIQTIGDEPASQLEFAMPGDTLAEQLVSLSQAFNTLTGAPLAEPVRAAFANADAPNLAVGIDISAGSIARVSAIGPRLGNDVVANLCSSLGLEFAETHPRLQASFGATGPDAVVYTRVMQTDAAPPDTSTGRDQIDLIVIPTGNEGKPPDQSN